MVSNVFDLAPNPKVYCSDTGGLLTGHFRFACSAGLPVLLSNVVSAAADVEVHTTAISTNIGSTCSLIHFHWLFSVEVLLLHRTAIGHTAMPIFGWPAVQCAHGDCLSC